MFDMYAEDPKTGGVYKVSIEQFGEMMRNNRVVARDEEPELDRRVSTVFLGVDHSFGNGPPVLYETMVFPMDSYSEIDMDRYCTRDEAVEGHRQMCLKHLGRLPK